MVEEARRAARMKKGSEKRCGAKYLLGHVLKLNRHDAVILEQSSVFRVLFRGSSVST